MLGVMYNMNEGVRDNTYQKPGAAAWYERFAQAAAYGVPQDHEQAAAWYRKAAEQGLPEAQLGLGLMYYNGEGVPQDHEDSIIWIRKSG